MGTINIFCIIDHDNQIVPPAIGGNVADGKGSDIATSMAVIQSKMVNLKEKVKLYIYICTCISYLKISIILFLGIQCIMGDNISEQFWKV